MSEGWGALGIKAIKLLTTREKRERCKGISRFKATGIRSGKSGNREKASQGRKKKSLNRRQRRSPRQEGLPTMLKKGETLKKKPSKRTAPDIAKLQGAWKKTV